MAHCKNCGEVDVHSYADGDGAGRNWTVFECARCGDEEIWADEECAIPWEYEPPEPYVD